MLRFVSEGKLVAIDFAVGEEALYFFLGSFQTIRCMSDVDHHVCAELCAQCARCCFLAVGHTEHIADFVDDVVAFDDHGNDWKRGHERFDVWVEWLIGNVRVMFLENVWCQLDHFATADRETGFLEAGNDFAAETAFNGVWLKENKRALHKNEVENNVNTLRSALFIPENGCSCK